MLHVWTVATCIRYTICYPIVYRVTHLDCCHMCSIYNRLSHCLPCYTFGLLQHVFVMQYVIPLITVLHVWTVATCVRYTICYPIVYRVTRLDCCHMCSLYNVLSHCLPCYTFGLLPLVFVIQYVIPLITVLHVWTVATCIRYTICYPIVYRVTRLDCCHMCSLYNMLSHCLPCYTFGLLPHVFDIQ